MPAFTRLSTTWQTSAWAMVMPVRLEVGPMGVSRPSMGKAASPGSPQLSMVTSAISYIFLPELWREAQLFAFEQKLGLMRRFREVEDGLNKIAGLADEIAEKSKQYIKIPMEGQLESLNAAVAAAILMYEASRQRRI